MKRLISIILAMALMIGAIPMTALADVVYPSVNVTFVGTEMPSEEEFRAWAGEVIYQYYSEYCEHERYRSENQYEDFQFKRGYKDQYTGTYDWQFDGVYREYYFASLAKLEYDFNEKKSSYDVLLHDSEDVDEFRKNTINDYVLMLIDTIQEKEQLDPHMFDKYESTERGLYTIDMTTGELVYDAKGIMGDLEYIETTRMEQAGKNFLLSAVDLTIELIKKEIETKKEGKIDDFIGIIADAIINVLEGQNNARMNNIIHALENDIMSIQKEKIVNGILQHDRRIVKYLENVYGGKAGDELVNERFLNDPLFMEAVNALIGLIKGSEEGNRKAAVEAVNTYYAQNELNLKHLLSDDEIESMLIENIIIEGANGIIQTIRSDLEEGQSELGVTDLELITDLVEEIVIKGLKTVVDEQVKAVKDGRKFDMDSKEFQNKLLTNLCTAIFERISNLGSKDVLSKLKNTPVNNAATGIWVDLANNLGELARTLYNEKDNLTMENEKVKNCLDKFADYARMSLLNFFVKGEIAYDLIIKAMKDETGGAVKAWILNDKITEAVGVITDVYSKVWDTAKAGIDFGRSVLNDKSDEAQVSYRAVAMYYAYKASSPLERNLQIKIETELGNTSSTILAKVMQPETTLETLLYITDRIMLQCEFDMVGYKWLIEILAINEGNRKAFFKSEADYVKFMKQQTDNTAWNGKFDNDNETIDRYNTIEAWRSKWRSGWNESFRKLAA